MMNVGDKVAFQSTEKVKQGRRKVEVAKTVEGVITRLYTLGGKDYADVEVGSLLNGGMTIVAIKRLDELAVTV